MRRRPKTVKVAAIGFDSHYRRIASSFAPLVPGRAEDCARSVLEGIMYRDAESVLLVCFDPPGFREIRRAEVSAARGSCWPLQLGDSP